MRQTYTVEYIVHQYGEVKRICFASGSKALAWEKAVFELIPKEEGAQPYAAWVTSVTYQNGNERRFNTHCGKPY